MPRKPKPKLRPGGPTQTTPGGLEIPVITRGEFFKSLGKVAKKEAPAKPEPPSQSAP
jgi:hypothetical protein